MKEKLEYRSDAEEAIHQTVSGLYETGIIKKETLREFDESCLTPIQKQIMLSDKSSDDGGRDRNRLIVRISER